MATTSNTSGEKAAATRKRNTARKSATATKANATRTAKTAKRSATRTTASTRSNAKRTAKTAGTTARQASSATAAESRVYITQAQQIAERAVLVPVGASLLARDNLVSTVKGLAGRYRSRAAVERELKRYERRGATARNRLERQVRRTRTKVERDLRQRRNRVERTVKQNRRRVERDIRSNPVGARVEKIVAEASDRLPIS